MVKTHHESFHIKFIISVTDAVLKLNKLYTSLYQRFTSYRQVINYVFHFLIWYFIDNIQQCETIVDDCVC